MKDFTSFFIAGLIVVLLWLTSLFVLPMLISDSAGRGLFGDSFGAVNALFSGLAFAGIISTIMLQRKELELQRKELELTREELQKSAKAQDATQKALNSQVELMTEQAILSAYQTSFANNLRLLESKWGSSEDRQSALNEQTVLKNRIDTQISYIRGFKKTYDDDEI